MKYLMPLLSITLMILFIGCSSKQDALRVSGTITDYNSTKNILNVEVTQQNESPYKIKYYDIRIKDSDNISWVHSQDKVRVEIHDLSKDGKIIKFISKIKGGMFTDYHKKELLVPGLQLLMHELDDRGIKYFQIVKPLSLSNMSGFPINNVANLSTYLVPEINSPSYDYYLENSTDNHSSMDAAFTILTYNTFILVIVPIENPQAHQMVWDVKKNLN